MSGPPLGRPPQKTAENAQELQEKKRQLQQDERDRIPVEGKFGQGKRRFGLDLIMAKLASTSESAIAITFIVMNLEKWLKKLFFAIFFCFRNTLYRAWYVVLAFITWQQRIMRTNRMSQWVIKEQNS